jgi:hypothetical protein
VACRSDKIALRELLEKGSDTTWLRAMVDFAGGSPMPDTGRATVNLTAHTRPTISWNTGVDSAQGRIV